ncbi:hypothetical protein HMPREF0322_01947 [Desulfitobacterium hafniense DP7]|uniref:Polysulfide reductase, NrfD n=1 Tax=Desulfitobacterium hafniense DP7 TaxID=537010 RepID=G9XLW1_DESHA|nr:DmsC/YnfH family molybdoenzyme membrane anchor subunit [Desulfitobacterium hafniense]EHL07387.1 hypothetical protein HMPREF0322_01947 [Desulfitobacterium hafniense DP7]
MSIEWALVFFTVFVGLGCGIFVSSVILTEWVGKATQVRRISSLTALAALAAGGFASVLHLGHPERIFGALGHPTSGIFMESTMLGLVGLDIIIYLLAIRRGASKRTLRVVSIFGLIPAVVLAFAVGYTYVLPSRPAWNTLVLPFIYLTSAGIMGCFSLSVLIAHTSSGAVSSEQSLGVAESAVAVTGETVAATLKKAVLAALGIQAVLLIAYLVHLATAPYPDVSRSVARVLAGDLAPLFWGGAVLLGLLVPGALISKIKTKGAGENFSFISVTLGLVCVIVSSGVFRIVMFSLGSSVKPFYF